MPEKDMERDVDAFRSSIDAATDTDTRGYLGDANVVNAFLRDFAAEAMKLVDKKDLLGIERACEKAAKVLLGSDDKNYHPMPKWNEPGGIDEFAAKWCGVLEGDPHERMKGALLSLVGELCDVASLASQKWSTKDQWGWQVDAVLDKYTQLFIGIDLPTQLLG